MRTIYYLGENIDVTNVISIEIKLTSLGESNLNITKFTGDFIHSITTGSAHPTGTAILENAGEVFTIGVGEVKTVFINLKLNNIDSLPTEVYIETEELGETTGVLIFRGGIDPGVITIPPLLRIQESDIILQDFPIETNKTNVTNQELGTFNIINIGASDLTIDSINYIDYTLGTETIKDFMSFRDSLGNPITTVPANGEIIIYIDIDSRTSGSGSPTKFFLEDYNVGEETTELDLNFNGFIEITSNDKGNSNTKHRITVSGGAIAPLIGYEFIHTFKQTNELIFNYRYNKENTKDLENKLRLYNNGSTDLIISEITTDYSVSVTNSIIYPIITNDLSSHVTIPSGGFYEFNFIFDPIRRANKLDEDGNPVLNSLEDYKEEIIRNLLIKSNALNYTYHSDADYGVSFTNRTAVNKKEFLSSIWYETSPYSWYPIERNEFIFSLLKPGGRNLQKLQIYNGMTAESEETFRIQIVYHGEEVGTTSFLSNDNYRNQLSSKDSIFLNVGSNEISGDTDDLGEFQTYVNVSLSMQADEDRYVVGEKETDPLQGGDPNLIGFIRKKYDFIKDVNPFKILFTRVTDDQEQSNGNINSFFDAKDQKEYWDVLDGTGLPESLLLYLTAITRRITLNSSSLASLTSSIYDLIEVEKTTPLKRSFILSILAPFTDQNVEFKNMPYGIHKSVVQSYSSSFLNVQQSLNINSEQFIPKTLSYSIGNLSLLSNVDSFKTLQKTTYSSSLTTLAINLIKDVSVQQFLPTIFSNNLASLSSYVNINEMLGGKSVEVDTGFIQGYDPSLQPPIMSTSLATIGVKEYVSNNAWNALPNINEYWNLIDVKRVTLFIPEEIKSYSLASLSLLEETLNINTQLLWGVQKEVGNLWRSVALASINARVSVDNADINQADEDPISIFSYALGNFNLSDVSLFKGERGIKQATATDFPELAINIYSHSIVTLSLEKDEVLNKPLTSSREFGATKFEPSADPPITSYSIVTLVVEDVNLGELYA